jgi:DinB family protein
MNTKEALSAVLKSTQQMVGWYLGDLSDADILIRPVPAANHIAWQLGHLIDSERKLTMSQIPGSVYPELPAGWSDQHGKTTASMDPPKGFASKAEYVSLFNKVREASLAALAKIPDADLDKPVTGPMAQYVSTLGNLFVMHGNHVMMHAGQFTVVRRKLGKPVLF